MTLQEFDRQLEHLRPGDSPGAEALAAGYAEGAKDLARYLVQAALAGGGMALKSLAAAEALREAAASALLEQIDQAPPLAAEPFLLQAMRNLNAARAAVVARLRLALTDTRVIEPEPSRHTAEEPEPAFRVRDDAYLALRRILKPEPEIHYQLEVSAFLALDEDARRELVSEFSKTGLFRDLVEREEE